jgi:Ti-type conjugative transfer relaxase TraA
MAIGYARVEFVKRSDGKTSCAKAAYNSRTRIEFHGNCALDPENFDWASKEPPTYHEILLPSGANEKFKSPQVLWNAVEIKEKKYNSQVAIELLLALPDDKIISLEDRIHLSKTFVQTHFVDKGLAAQIDVHPPERRIKITRDNREIGLYKEMLGNVIEEKEDCLTVQFDSKRTISFNPKEFTGFIETENNWHAHVLITTRRFQKDGLDLEDTKARDLMPRICKGKVVSGDDWGKLWTDHQNKFFQERGLNLRVDTPGIEPQEHLGPVRMRGRAFDLLEEHSQILDRNSLKVKDPSEVLKKITERQSIFTKEDVDRFIQKHLPAESHTTFKEDFWKQKELTPLINKQTGELTGKFSSQKVIEEEASILRLADRIHSKEALRVDMKRSDVFTKTLNSEQITAFNTILHGKKMACLQGYAGTGKSHLLAALKTAYSHSGYNVRAFGPDNATADVLREKGFQNAENIYRFLYGFHNSKRNAAKNNEVWILDEAGKLGNRPLLELLKASYKQGAQVIFSGDYAQLSSVERGGMFRVFCERYDSPILKDIQRQKTENQREIAKNLAMGEIGSAIDKLSAASTIKWSASRKEAVEALISKWALDTRSRPNASTLLIAHSNDEVRVLNEMVRIIKKQRGELSDKEFACETSLGKVYLGVGDQIEFRKNDKNLGVTNGLSGVLIEVTEKKFVVSIGKDEQKSRIVTFNPQEYYSYQLGYAATHYRSQGKTVDMAYVLHSPALNKRLFYVGLTRHSHEAYYFVSKDQAYCLSDLKRQAVRESIKDNTLAFTTAQEVELQQKNAQTQQEIQQLKESDSFTGKIKGYGLAAFDLIKSKTSDALEHRRDKAPSGEFFKPPAADESIKAAVKEVEAEINLKETLKAILSQENAREISPTSLSNVGQTPQRKTPEQQLARAQEVKQSQWLAFGVEKQAAVQSYFSVSDQAFTLKTVVDLEAENAAHGISSTPHFREWQAACGKRNASAQILIQRVSPEDLNTFLGKNAVKQIVDQASRYQLVIEQNENSGSQSVEEELKANVEPLLYRIFPEGPYQRNKQEFRFGNKGSLSVIHAGEKAGQFYDFERQEGGSVLKLVQREMGLGRLEALEWAKDFLGMVKDLHVPKPFQKPNKEVSADRDWVSLKPDPSVPAPALKDLPGKKLHHYFDEVTRHAYRDEAEDLLYYRLRLRDKQDPSKKFTPPLSYGYWKSDPGKPGWELKGFDSGKNVLYNLPLLKKNPLATILVVEGEKTADQSHSKFPGENIVSITWPGGAGAARRADWSPLVGRDVIVWPDNDKPGYQAGEDVCRELKKIGVKSLQMVDPLSLKKSFPEKWDLADPLPADASQDLPKKLLQSAIQKGLDPQQVLYRVSSVYKEDLIDRARVNEILWRVDDRLRPDLEQKGHRKINEAILNETARILLQRPQGKQSHRVFWQTLVYEAQYGRNPAVWEVEKITEIIQRTQSSPDPKDRLEELSLDKSITRSCEKALFGHEISTKESLQESVSISHKLREQVEQLQSIEKISYDRQPLERDK